MARTSGHTFWAAANAAKSPIAGGDGGCAVSTGQRGSTEAAGQSSMEGGEGRTGVGKGGSTLGDEEAVAGGDDAAGVDAVGRLKASATMLPAPGV
jgi:hypothetical protein